MRRETVGVLDEILEMNATYGTLTAAEAYNEYREIVDSDKVEMIDRRVVKRIMDGKKMSANDVLSIQRGRVRLIPKLHAQLGGALLVMPTTPITAPEVAPLEADDAVFHKTNLLALRNTALGNILDLCAVALPNGRDGNGMPTSILFSAAHGADEMLLGTCAGDRARHPRQQRYDGSRKATEDGMSADKPRSEKFERGLKTRRAVLGADYVDHSLEQADDFNWPMQQLTTEWCWDEIWNRPGLDRRSRSILNLGMIAALNRPHEFKLHVRGAINNGLTKES